ncbi:single-stranded DNA-binding protein [Halomonas caseinilytica]|uniref:single-stranded DNA-binding protein n=1 Tax=Halomonas caseinilytica TaxID=438744 RepID=UPI0008493038|nr:single-stranded DNA-binding protein [Halomonas caseinilytica]
MANDLNACHFTGRLGADPEVRFLQSGDPVANLRLAVGKQWRDRQSGQKQEATSWINCVAFKKTAELAQQYLTKGAQIRVTCEMRERQWQDQQGNNRNAVEFVIREMQFLGGGQQQGGAPQGGQRQGAPAGQPGNPGGSYPQGGAMGGQPQGGANPGAPNTGGFDDEIPFAPMHPLMGG